MDFSDVVTASTATASTSKRSQKIEILACALRMADPSEIAAAVGFLRGEPRQRRVGVGHSTLRSVERPAAARPRLSVAAVDEALDTLAEIAGAGAEKRRHDELEALFAQATAAEQEFLRRLLVGELRQGALEGLLTRAVAKAASVSTASVERALMLSGELAATAEIALGSGACGLEAVRLRLFVPLKPMLATAAGDVGEALEALSEAFVEWKLDGARVQVHRDRDSVRVFTRNLNDVTDRLPEIVEQVRGFPVESCVLDGEVLALGQGARPAVFQDSMSRFGSSRRSSVQLEAFYFDCLQLDGVEMIDESFVDRRAALERVGGMAVVPGAQVGDVLGAASFLDQAISEGHEGVMIKALDAPYQAGRRGRSWLKVKPVITVDLVVIAAEWGRGRREGWLSNLHLAARDENGNFVMVGKTFKGMTDELLQWQTDELLARQSAQQRRGVEVRPELVVEIALDGVQRSTRYSGGVALRFARVKSYREDKHPADATTIEELRAMLGRDVD